MIGGDTFDQPHGNQKQGISRLSGLNAKIQLAAGYAMKLELEGQTYIVNKRSFNKWYLRTTKPSIGDSQRKPKYFDRLHTALPKALSTTAAKLETIIQNHIIAQTAQGDQDNKALLFDPNIIVNFFEREAKIASHIHNASTTLQKVARGLKARKAVKSELAKARKAATTIQAYFKGFKARKAFKAELAQKQERATARRQEHYQAHNQRKQLAKARLEAQNKRHDFAFFKDLTARVGRSLEARLDFASQLHREAAAKVAETMPKTASA